MKVQLSLTLLLWFFYVALVTEPTLFDVTIGLFFSIGCAWFTHKLMPLPSTANVRFSKICYWLPWLIVRQIYVAGFVVIKAIFTGAKLHVVEVETSLSSPTLRIMLSRSVTLVPGSALLNLEGNVLTIMWLQPKDAPDPQTKEELHQATIASLEQFLMRAEV